jgi:hypothetical protein
MPNVTPAKLRALAFKLADEWAVRCIECNCCPAGERDRAAGEYREWWLPDRNDAARADVLEALRYCVARRLMVWHRRAGIIARAQ